MNCQNLFLFVCGGSIKAYENKVKSWTKSNYLYENAAGIFYVWEANKNNGEKTAENLFFTENCTKQQYRFEAAGFIFNLCGGRMETYWKVNEAAAALQVSVKTIYRYVANGEIPFHKLRRAVRFKPSEIENWMEGKKTEAVKHEM
ncbi:helix-turn-helix domain-containing protein [Treponema sp. R8-4-B8]